MRERATEEVTPRLEVSVEVAGNRELDALNRLLANASATASAPTAPLAPLVIHGVEIRVVALTFSLLFPDAVLVPHLDDDATDDDDAIARETNAGGEASRGRVSYPRSARTDARQLWRSLADGSQVGKLDATRDG